MADFIGPKERLTVSQAAARRKKIELSQVSQRAEDLAKAKAKAPTPKSETPAGRMQAELAKARAGAPVPKSVASAATKPSLSNAAKVKNIGGKVLSTAVKGGKKLVTGRVGAGIAVATLVGGPILKQLSKDTEGRTTGDMLKAREKAAVTSNKPSTPNKPGKQANPNSRVKDYDRPNKITNSATKSTSSKYRVETGDTLSGIAKRAGVTLAELRAANPQIKDPRKIFRNTGVTIPKGKTASGGYTGPTPYRPGSKAAADYEAKRKKK